MHARVYFHLPGSQGVAVTTNNHISKTFKAVLVSLRDADDPMNDHERRCFLAASGLERLDVVFAARGDLETTSQQEALVASSDLLLFGGSGAYSVLDSQTWVRRFIDFLPLVPERGVPAWASCFAFQGLALAMGGEVVRNDERQQLGACSVSLTTDGREDRLFGALPDRFHAQFGHHDHVSSVPLGVTVLATGNGIDCQAFRVDNSTFWGAQFHPELDKKTTLERWNHYRKNYEGTEGDAIDRRLRNAPETPEPGTILRTLVKLARER